MSINLHHSSNINLDWTIAAAPGDDRPSRQLRFPPRDPAALAAGVPADNGGYAGAPTPLRERMLQYFAHMHPPAGAPSGAKDLSAGPGGNWAPVARQQDIDRGSPLRSATSKGIRAWDTNDLSRSLTKWGHDAPRTTVTQDTFCPPAYAIIRGGGQVARDMSGVDPSLYETTFDLRPVDSGDGPRRHLESKVDIQEDKARLRLPDSSDNEQFKAARNRVDASLMPEAGARWSSFEGEGGREGTIVDFEGKIHHPELDSRKVRRKAAVHAPGIRMYEPNIATVKVRDWGHEPVRTTVTRDVFFSDKALNYATEQAARRAQAGAAFATRTKPTVRAPPMHATFSGEGNRRHLQTHFTTKEEPERTIPDRGDHELYKRAPGRVDATQLPEAGAHHTAFDDKDLSLFPLNKQRLAQPTENPGVKLLDQTPGTSLHEWNHPRVSATQTMEDFRKPPLPPPPGSSEDVPGAGYGGKVGEEAPGTRSGLDPRRHLATQFTTKVPGMAGGAHEGGTVKLEMRRDIHPTQIPAAGSAAVSRQAIAGDLPNAATRDAAAPAAAITAAGKVPDRPRQVGPPSGIVDQTFSSVKISHEDDRGASPPIYEEKVTQRRRAGGVIAAKMYKTHRFEPVEPSRHTYKYRASPPAKPKISEQHSPTVKGARMSGNPADREWRSEHTSAPTESAIPVPPWGDEEFHYSPDGAKVRNTDTFRQTHLLQDQEAHLRPGSPPHELRGGLEPTNPYAAPSTKQSVDKPVNVRVTDTMRTTLPKQWDGEEAYHPDSPLGRHETTGREVGAEADEEDIVRVDPLRSASALSFGPGTSVPGIGKRPDGANSLRADYTSKDQLRFELSALQPRESPKITNTMRISRPLDNRLDTSPDHDGPDRWAATTSRELGQHSLEHKPKDVNAGAHYARGTSLLGTRPDGEGFKADVQTTDYHRYVPSAKSLKPGDAPYETKKTDFTTTAQDIAPRTPRSADETSPKVSIASHRIASHRIASHRIALM